MVPHLGYIGLSKRSPSYLPASAAHIGRESGYHIGRVMEVGRWLLAELKDGEWEKDRNPLPKAFHF